MSEVKKINPIDVYFEPQENEDLVQAYINKDLKKAVKAHLKKNGRTTKEFITASFKRYLIENGIELTKTKKG